MSLIKCKECGKEISDTAPKCVHCGAKTETKTIKDNLIKKVFLIVLLVIAICILILGACHLVLISRESYKYGEQVLDLLNSYKESNISEKRLLHELDYIYDDVKDTMENTTDIEESTRLLRLTIMITGLHIDSHDGITMYDINESIKETKEIMKLF